MELLLAHARLSTRLLLAASLLGAECYVARSCFCPSNLNQYPAGPYPSVPPMVEVIQLPCQTLPPMPSSPYADPAAFYRK